MRPKSLLITGATGVIGQSVLGHLDSSSWDEIRLLIHKAEPPPGTWNIARGDLKAQSPLDQAMSGIDVVLHLAGQGHAHGSEEYRRLNVQGTRVLLGAAERTGVRRFVFVSSLAAGSTGGAYARSKSEAENVVVKSPIPWTILCPAEVYGTGSGGFVDRLVRLVWQWRVVPIPGDGSDRMAPVHVEDVSLAITASLSADEALGRRLVLAGNDIVTVRELVDKAGQLVGRRALAVPVPWWMMRGAARLARWAGSNVLVEDQIDRLRCKKQRDSAEAIAILGFDPRGLDEGLRDLARVLKGTALR